MTRVAMAAVVFVSLVSTALAGPDMITYQGYVTGPGGAPVADNRYDMRFRLYNALTGGTPRWTEMDTSVSVQEGLFSTILGDGTGLATTLNTYPNLWLEVSIDLNRDRSFDDSKEVYSPRQRLTSAAWAINANNADGLGGQAASYYQRRVSGTASTGQYVRQIKADGTVVTGSDNGDISAVMAGTGLSGGATSGAATLSLNTGYTDSRYWMLAGNAGLTSGAQFLGTRGGVPLDLRTSGTRALRLMPTAGTPNVVGGYSGNSAVTGVVGATIGGGGNVIGVNIVTDDYGTVGGGIRNRAGDSAGTVSDARCATVGGGQNNSASGSYAAVGGGRGNTAGGPHATVGGGYSNTAINTYATVGGGSSNTAGEEYATVGGGDWNTASGQYATVGGGWSNTASELCAAVAGGYLNTASGQLAAVGGGYLNTAINTCPTVAGGYGNAASQSCATVAGGYKNAASEWCATVAGGQNNTASFTYATVGGGHTNAACGQYATVPGGSSNTARADYSFAAGRRAKANNAGSFAWADSTNADFNVSNNNRFGVRASGGVYLYTNSSLTAGSYLAAGSGSWTSVSDRAMKENVAPVNAADVLEKVAVMPISAWNYKTEDRSIRHIGPMAQDFHAAFGLGDSDKAITTIDADGVALAAIQALHKLVREKEARITTLEADKMSQQQRIANLEARLAALESRRRTTMNDE